MDRVSADGDQGESSDVPGIAERFRMIAAQAKITNEQRVHELMVALDRWSAGTLTEIERSRAADVAHKIAGSAGTFGYREASETARELEQWLADETPKSGQPMIWIEQLQAGLAVEPAAFDD